MAQGYGREGKALLPLRYVANLFKQQTLDQLEINMATQHVWPYAVYSTYPEVNEYRRQHGGWYSTGEGVKSFEGVVYEADEKSGIVSMGFKFSDYLQFVDIGVGSGRKAENVDRSRKVRFKSRYTQWKPSQGKTHRPGIQPEILHTLTRLENFVQRYYDAKLDFQVVETIEGHPLEIKF